MEGIVHAIVFVALGMGLAKIWSLVSKLIISAQAAPAKCQHAGRQKRLKEPQQRPTHDNIAISEDSDSDMDAGGNAVPQPRPPPQPRAPPCLHQKFTTVGSTKKGNIHHRRVRCAECNQLLWKGTIPE